MTKWVRNITAIGLCAALCIGGVAFAQTGDKQTEPETVKSETKAAEATQQEIFKDETVYVLAGADGSVQKIIVSDWIKNTLADNTVSDKSELSNIENVKGEESYTMSGENVKVWNTQGNDVYYQGDIEKELPVNLTVTYKLDGKNVSAQEIAGKSGKVTIRFDYENCKYEMVKMDGKEEKIYVPFAMLTGMILDNDTFRNVEVSNGKLINDGDRTVVIGLAFPGLQENLGLSLDKIEIPNYVEITADATDFEFGMTVTVATNEIFTEFDDTSFDSTANMAGSLSELTDAMTQLMNGSSALYDGICTLLDKSNELVAGVEQLATGAKSLKDGAASLNDGAVQMKTGMEGLASGLGTLSSNSASMNNGATQVFNSLLSMVANQIRSAGVTIPDLTIDNYAQVLNGIITALDETSIYNQVLQQVETQVIETSTQMSKEAYDAAVAAGLISEQQQDMIVAAINQQMISEIVQTQLTAASESAKSVIALKASLDSYNTFYLGLHMYTEGVDSAASGATELYAGASALETGAAQLKAGASTLYDGVLTLKDGMPALVDGVTQLRNGAMELSDGLKQFNEQGIQKLVDLLDGDIEEILTRLKATVDVSKDYCNFAGIGEDMEGQVKFIYRTEDVKAN